MSNIPLDPAFDSRVRASFERQVFMKTLGARLVSIAPGEVVVELPFRDDLTQQHGSVHAGVVASIADTACGYAALTLMSAEAAVISVEFKINLLAPAVGQSFLATGRVLKAGKTITVCTGEVLVLRDGSQFLVAQMQTTMMTLRDRPGLRD
jgi:uncharacterized protein (TIGR00369 family)